MPSVSVILVGHDSRALLERALASVEGAAEGGQRLAGGGGEVELVLVDNASSDGTADFVRERFPDCRVIEAGENLGFGRASNLAARETTGELILLLNPDAWVGPSCLDRLCAAMADDPGLGWAAPTLRFPGGGRQLIWGPTVGVLGEAVQLLRNRHESSAWVHDTLPRALRSLGDPGWFSAACALIRRRAWDEVGGFDPGFFLYFEDADLGLRMRRAGWRLALVPEALAYHDRHGPSPTSDRLVHYRESQLRYYRKHRPRWESRLVLRKQSRAARRIADPATRAKVLAVCERARAAFEAGVVDLPERSADSADGGAPTRTDARPAGLRS